MQLENCSGEPVFKIGDVVYLKPVPGIDGYDWPAIGSRHEIDCKILNLSTKKEIIGYDKSDNRIYSTDNYYDLITGNGNHLSSVKEKSLVHPKNRHLHMPSGYFTITVDNELCPKDTVFILNGEWYSNEELGIYINVIRAKSIANLFSNHKPVHK